MPVNRSPSNKAREENIRAEIHAGKPIKQAVAIGYSEQRQAMKKRSGGMGGGHSEHGKDGIPHTIHHQHGAAGSHEHTHHSGHQAHINTGHPDELESYHGKMGKNG